MGAIVDTLLLAPQEVTLMLQHWTNTVVKQLTAHDGTIQLYRIVVPEEEEMVYYQFLADNHLQFFSDKFRSRLASDTDFAMTLTSPRLLNE